MGIPPKPRAKRKLDRAQPQEEGRHNFCAAPNGARKSLKFPSTGLRPWLWLFRRYAAMKPNGPTPIPSCVRIDMRQLHVALFNRSFYPDTAATGQLLTELWVGLVKAYNCRVSVIAGVPLIPSDSGAVRRKSRGIVIREEYRGIEILRSRRTRFSKRRFAGRAMNYVTYFMSACYAGMRLDRPDVIVAATDPPIIGIAAYMASQRFHAPLVMAYQDIFPEVGRLLEDFQSDTVNRVLQFVNCFLARRAARNVALGETMRRRLIEGKGAHPARTIVIPSWADCSQIVPGFRRNRFSRDHGLDDKFVIMHSGNIGLSQDLEKMIEVAEH